MRSRTGDGNRKINRSVGGKSPAADLHRAALTDVVGRYAALWQEAVRQEQFRLFVYPSSDIETTREIDFAESAPELAAEVGRHSGTEPQPGDLMVGIGPRMTMIGKPNDPECWASIDAGEYVCLKHFGTGDGRMGWEQRSLLVAATAFTVFAAAPNARHSTCSDGNGGQQPKVDLLADYLVWVAADARYTDDRHRGDHKAVIGRFAEEHVLTWSMIYKMAEIAPVRMARGPLSPEIIAVCARVLLEEAHKQAFALPGASPSSPAHRAAA